MLANATTRQDLRRALQEAASQNDAAAILASGRNLIAASGALGDIKFCASLFAENSAAIKDQLKARTLRTFVVRSVTIEPILPFLAVEAVLANYMLDLRIGGFGSYFDELMNPASELASFAPDVALILLDLEDIAGRLRTSAQTALAPESKRRSRTQSPAWNNSFEVSDPEAPAAWSFRAASSPISPRLEMSGTPTFHTAFQVPSWR